MAVTYTKPKDYAARRGVCSDTVYDAVRRGELKSIRIGRAIRIIEEIEEPAPRTAEVAHAA